MNLDDLANQFFRVFSRTEYALKASGYNSGNGEAKANWQKFALDIESLISNPSSPELKEAVDSIFRAPPKKQIIADAIIQWEVAEPATSSRADKLLIYIRRIRNNLFHGGKFNGHWFEPDRSEHLLKNSITILLSCIESIDAVRDAYYG